MSETSNIYLGYGNGFVLHNGLPVMWKTIVYPDWTDADLIIERYNCSSDWNAGQGSYLGFTSPWTAVPEYVYQNLENNSCTKSANTKDDPWLVLNGRETSAEYMSATTQAGITAVKRCCAESSGKFMGYYYDDTLSSHYYLGFKWGGTSGVPQGTDLTNHGNPDGYSKILKYRTSATSLYYAFNGSNYTDIMNMYAPRVNSTTMTFSDHDDFYQNKALSGLYNVYMPLARMDLQEQPIHNVTNVTAKELALANTSAEFNNVSGLSGSFGGVTATISPSNYKIDNLIYIGGSGLTVNDYNMPSAVLSHSTGLSGSFSCTKLFEYGSATTDQCSIYASSAWVSGNSTARNVFASSAITAKSATLDNCSAKMIHTSACTLGGNVTADGFYVVSGLYGTSAHVINADYLSLRGNVPEAVNWNVTWSAATPPSIGSTINTVNISSDNLFRMITYSAERGVSNYGIRHMNFYGSADFSKISTSNLINSYLTQMYGATNYSQDGNWVFDFSHVHFIQPTANVRPYLEFSGKDFNSSQNKSFTVKLPSTAQNLEHLRFTTYGGGKITIQYV